MQLVLSFLVYSFHYPLSMLGEDGGGGSNEVTRERATEQTHNSQRGRLQPNQESHRHSTPLDPQRHHTNTLSQSGRNASYGERSRHWSGDSVTGAPWLASKQKRACEGVIVVQFSILASMIISHPHSYAYTHDHHTHVHHPNTRKTKHNSHHTRIHFHPLGSLGSFVPFSSTTGGGSLCSWQEENTTNRVSLEGRQTDSVVNLRRSVSRSPSTVCTLINYLTEGGRASCSPPLLGVLQLDSLACRQELTLQ